MSWNKNIRIILIKSEVIEISVIKDSKSHMFIMTNLLFSLIHFLSVEDMTKEIELQKVLRIEFSRILNANLPFFYEVIVKIQNKSEINLKMKILDVGSDYSEVNFFCSLRELNIEPLETKEILVSLNSEIIENRDEAFIILEVCLNGRKEIFKQKINFPFKDSLFRYALIWEKTRDIELLTSKNIEKTGQNLRKILLELCYTIRKYYSFHHWVLYVQDLLSFDSSFYNLFQQSIDNTFVNIILGRGSSGKYYRIQTKKQLEFDIEFLILNTNLTRPNIAKIQKIIENSYSILRKTNTELDRILSIIQLEKTIFHEINEFYEIIKCIKQGNVPTFNFDLPVSLNLEEKTLEELKDAAKQISFKNIDEKIIAFKGSFNKAIFEKNFADFMFIFGNICYLYGIKFNETATISLQFSSWAIDIFKQLEFKEMIDFSNFRYKETKFYQLFKQNELEKTMEILEFYDKKINKIHNDILYSYVNRFLIIGYYISASQFYYTRDLNKATESLKKSSDYIEKIKIANESTLSKYVLMVEALEQEIEASKIYEIRDFPKKIVLLENAKRIYFKLNNLNKANPLVHIILNYNGLIEIEKGNFSEARNLFIKASKEANKSNHNSELYKLRIDLCSIFILITKLEWVKVNELIKGLLGKSRYRRSTFVLFKTLELIINLIQALEVGNIDIKLLVDIYTQFLDLSYIDGDFLISDTLSSLFFEIYSASILCTLNYPKQITNQITKTAVNRISKKDFMFNEFVFESLTDILERPWAFYLNEGAMMRYRKYEEYKYLEPDSSTLREDAVFKLLSSFEMQLRFLAEYYLRLTFGNEWEKRVSEHFNDSKTFERMSLGDIIQTFMLLEKYDLRLEQTCKISWSDISDKIVKVRNDLAHGNVDSLPEEIISETEDSVLTTFKKLYVISPVQFKVDDILFNKYMVTFLTDIPYITRLVSAEITLSKNKEYIGVIDSKTRDEICIKNIIEIKD